MPKNGYFTKGTLGFLTELRAHNSRDWFQANKDKFESQVRDPFLRLIADLAPGLKKIAPGFIVDPSANGGSMMRIYRDIRISKDKSPYKPYAAAHFWHANGKDGAAPAYFLHLEPGNSVIGGVVEVSTSWNGERQRRPIGANLGMEPRARGPSAPGMACRGLHSKERQRDHGETR